MAADTTINLGLPYGQSATMSLAFSAAANVTVATLPRGNPLANPAQALAQALEAPYEWPPLAACTVPGDRIALAVHPELPLPEVAVAGVVEALLASGVEAGQISLVLAPAAERLPGDVTALLPDAVRTALHLVEHAPDESGALAYLAATRDARPIYVNRALAEADLVIPLGVNRCPGAPGAFGLAQCLFPVFCDRAARDHWEMPPSENESESDKRRHKGLDLAEATLALGARFAVLVTPGAGEEWLHVLAGDLERMAPRARELAEGAWQFPVTEPVQLVVAALSGPRHQTWSSLARALALAAQVAADQAALVFCTEIAEPADAVLRRAAAIDDDEVALRFLRKQKPKSAATPLAELLHRVRHEARVYLASRLPPDEVEEAGFSPLSTADEIARLARGATHVLLLPHAQHAALLPTATG